MHGSRLGVAGEEFLEPSLGAGFADEGGSVDGAELGSLELTEGVFKIDVHKVAFALGYEFRQLTDVYAGDVEVFEG